MSPRSLSGLPSPSLSNIEKMLEVQGKLAFCALTPTIEKTFHIMGLAQYASIHPDESAAVAQIVS